jgi:hypothetical protein
MDRIQIFSARQVGLSKTRKILMNWCWDLRIRSTKYTAILWIKISAINLKDHKKRLDAGDSDRTRGMFCGEIPLDTRISADCLSTTPICRLNFFPAIGCVRKLPALFDEYHHLLANKANEYFDSAFQN